MESWTEGLECRGTYYEGWVENAERVLTAHKKATVTCYGTRRSSRNSSSAPGHSSENDKENAAPINEKGTKSIPKLFWSKGQMEIDNTPFSITEYRRLECQFGPHYYKEKPQKSTRLRLQGSRKMGCHAHILIKQCNLYPQYKISDEECTKSTLRTLREKKMRLLKAELQDNPDAIKTKTMWFISLPSEDAHSGHPTGKGVAGFSQRMNDKVAAKIVEIVADGITEVTQVRNLLRHYVVHDLCKDEQPDPNDRAYFPMDVDIKNHIYMAKRSLQLSCLDQENARLKIQEWNETDKESTHFFRSYVRKDIKNEKVQSTQQSAQNLCSVEEENNKRYIGNDGIDDTIAIDDDGTYDQPLLWVYQTVWQKELLARYGNSISLIDATYKTTRYELALFFICVRTNVGYSVVAEFIVQSETAENIQEALSVLKQWNPEWCPSYFMTDYSEAEMTALEKAFPATTIFLCDFHREQAWVRWTRDHKHGLSPIEAEELLDLLRACAWAPPSDGADPGQHYQLSVSQLKQSSVWKNHQSVRQWLTNYWLPIPERWARAYRDNHYHVAVNTNNGVEAQNKLFKYKFLPRTKQRATLSSTMTILVEKYLPACKQKYLFQNYKQSPQYRSYKEFVPSYLHNRPRSVILHCLDRKTKSTKFSAHAIHDLDTENGIFEVEKSSDSKQVVNFGVKEQNGMPSCTCKDWQQYHIPCKHFFAVFEHRSKWRWEQLPKSYLQSAYLSSDTDALDKHFDFSANDDQPVMDTSITTENEKDTSDSHEDETIVNDLPKKNSTVSLKAAGEKVRTTLKEIETLSYSSGSVNDLIHLNDQLQLLKSEFETTLPHLEGLIIRPAVVSAALKTKRKYAYIRAKRYHTQCSALKLAKGRSRKKDSRFRNRFGIRADRLRKEARQKHKSQELEPCNKHDPSLMQAQNCQQSSGIQQTCAGSSTELTNVIIGNKRKRTRCGDCDGCQISEDCGTCPNCLDKPKFGGPGKKKQCCIKKKCVRFTFKAARPPSPQRFSARAFAMGLQIGTIQAPPGVQTPAIPFPVLKEMEKTDQWPTGLVL